MSFKNNILIGGTCIMLTYSVTSYAVHHKAVFTHKILRSAVLKVCNENQCVDLDRSQALPNTFNRKAPLGVEYALNNKEVMCLARQILQEPVKGNDLDRAGVAFATINRVKHREYPNTICKVISYKRGSRHDMSWFGNVKKRYAKPNNKDIDFAKKVLLGKVDNPIGKATNWYNITHDNPNSFNGIQYRKIKNAAFKLSGTPHIFIEIK